VQRCDFHIHTKYLGCGNQTLEVPAIVAECERVGVESIAITDHLNTVDRLPLHRPIREDILALAPDINVYFGAELNYQACDGEFAYSEQIRDEMGFQLAIGGIHTHYLEEYDLAKLVEVQQRHHLRVCEDPLVAVLVHPYWFGREDFDRREWPWFESLEFLPESCMRELGRASAETGTAIEINAMAIIANERYPERFRKEYEQYIAVMAEEGAVFSFGSDAHDIGHLAHIADVWQVGERLGLTDAQLWQPPCRPLIGPDAAGD